MMRRIAAAGWRMYGGCNPGLGPQPLDPLARREESTMPNHLVRSLLLLAAFGLVALPRALR
jgi:hypothetical protein